MIKCNYIIIYISAKDPNIRTVTEQNGSLQTSNAWSEANLFSKGTYPHFVYVS